MKRIVAIACLFMLIPSMAGNIVMKYEKNRIFIERNFEYLSFKMPGAKESIYGRIVMFLPFNISIKKVEIELYGRRYVKGGREIPPIKINGRMIKAKYPANTCSYKIGKGIYHGKRYTFIVVNAFPYNGIAEGARIKIDYERISFHNGEKYDMLIITPPAFYNESVELANFKNGRGTKTFVMTTYEIYSSYSGRDEAEKIKYAIKDAIEKYGIKYVLLMGNVSFIPPRYSHLNIVAPQFISDLYYADIYNADGNFSSWDTNGNGIYGEGDYRHLIDDVDMYPDVYVGRMDCRDINEAKIMVEKLKEYDGMNKSILLAGGDTHPWWKDVMASGIRGIEFEGIETCEEISSFMEGFKKIKLYARNIDNPLTDENIIKAINDGIGFALFSGHGLQDKWMTHPPYRKKWLPENGFSINDFRKVSISSKTVYVFDACLCGKIDEDCIAHEAMLRGIASMALTTYGLLIPGEKGRDSLNGYMTLAIFRNYNASTLGKMFFDGIVDYLNAIPHMPGIKEINYLTPEEWILIGDPSLEIKCSG